MTKVLIVEDNPALQQLLSRWFREDGCKVIVADNVVAAKNVLDEEHIDIALLDGTLNGIGHGQDVAAHIVNSLWPQQEKQTAAKTTFCTLSSEPYAADGTSAVYHKDDFFQMMDDSEEGDCVAWIMAMKEAPRLPANEPKVKQASVLAKA